MCLVVGLEMRRKLLAMKKEGKAELLKLRE
jgi:hypothetical protein